MKKILVIGVILNICFLCGYGQDTISIVEHTTIIEVIVSNSGYDKRTQTYHMAPATKKKKKVKRFFYTIGNQEERQLNGSDYKLYKEYISSNKAASKKLKGYVISKAAGLGGFVVILAGAPILLFAPPAGLILIGVGGTTMIVSKVLAKRLVLKSAKVFNQGLKNKSAS